MPGIVVGGGSPCQANDGCGLQDSLGEHRGEPGKCSDGVE